MAPKTFPHGPLRERAIDAPRDKPRVERGEHANLERPGAQFHPVAGARACARGWNRPQPAWQFGPARAWDQQG